MQEDTAQNILRVNMNMITALIAVGAAFITGVAWGVRLEYKTGENEKIAAKHEVEIAAMQQGNAAIRERFSLVELDLKYIKSGIEDIKTSVRKP